MLQVDQSILNTNSVICENIKHFNVFDRGFISQNILSQLRNFVEYIAIKIHLNGIDKNPNDQTVNNDALKYIKRQSDLQFLHKFHELLQKSVSHYTIDKDGSERLMLKYYEHLLKIKKYLKNKYNFDVLDNIQDFPLNTDTELVDYYKKIAERIDALPNPFTSYVQYNDRFYIQKIKPFFINDTIYYEITFTIANEKVSKFDRIIAFTRCEISDNYAVRFFMRKDIISILNKNMSILIIDNYETSIRPCEWENFARIFGNRIRCNTHSNEYRALMSFLSTYKMSLSELICSEQDYYDEQKRMITAGTQTPILFTLLDQCRNIILNNYSGTNVLRYLLLKMNNHIIKLQYWKNECPDLSNLHLQFGCIPFDDMPYCSSLIEHNPKISDLFESIPQNDREHELFARYIKNNTEIEGHLFTHENDIKDFYNIDYLINKFNSLVYYKHKNRYLKKFQNNIYIQEHVDNSTKIIQKLQDLASKGITQYTASVDSWISNISYYIDDNSKKEALRQMFENSKVAIIYGSAGTGKSTLIKHIANFWANAKKLFLANTHPAVDNLRRKVTARNSFYYTVAKFLSNKNINDYWDLLFIDECSTVSNYDMNKILEKAKFQALILVGDVYQIESILFGNWFSIAQYFIPKTSIFELKYPYRTTNKELLTVWDRVRNLNNAILEPLVKSKYTLRLNESIFEHSNEDEVILCLNYDGLYGINNINRFLQNNNPNPEFIWGVNSYKVGDPILFNESNIFSPLIHNNTKGRIVKIQLEEQKIRFDIELEEIINEIDANGYRFDLMGMSEKGHSIISFSINKLQSSDNDDDDSDSSIVPFQIAYAISIHKAQGLEYDSVKIVITNESEERITHNIFYTAITRTKNKLKIYWSPETEKYILGNLKIKNPHKDACLLAQLSGLKMV